MDTCQRNDRQLHTLDLNSTRIKPPRTGRQDMGVILSHNRNDRRPGLDSKMKSALLKVQQFRLIRITPRSLRENKDTLSMGTHFVRGTIKSLHCSLTVRTVNEHRTGKRHEPAQEGDVRERFLSRNTAIGREDSSEHKYVEFGLVVSDKHGRTSG